MQSEGRSMAGMTQGQVDGLAGVRTLPQLLRWRVGLTPGLAAYRHFDAGLARWVGFSWQQIDCEFERWRRALAAEGFAPGERIAILMPNGIAHIAMDQAALSRGLVPVPMHAVDNPDSIGYILQDSAASLLLVDSAERWQAIAATGQPLEKLKRVVCAELPAASALAAAGGRIATLDRWLETGAAGTAMHDVEVLPDDLAAIVYTSGTTGRPKGVMLSHANIVANVKAIHRRIAASQDDLFLSFLPLSHTFERTAGYYYPIAAGACVAYARSVQLLAEDLKQVQPTVLISVPRIYERIYALILQRRAASGRPQRALFDLTLAVGGRRFDARHAANGAASMLDRLAWPLLKRLVADRVRAQFGGRLRVAVSGGAPIAELVIRLFLSFGLEVLQGYGMTETSPVVAVNTVEDNDPRSVGRPLDQVEVRIGGDQELLVKGPGVMLGYWHRPDETSRVKDADGWLHTVDQARIDDGRITITGRIKDILVTSTGEKISPVDLETAILADPLFEQAMVIGERRPFLAALVVLNPKAWQQEQRKLAAGGQSGSQAEAGVLLKRIAEAVKAYPAYATPRAVWWSPEPWTIGAGLLTPTLKNKRAALEHRFAGEIDRIYARRPALGARSATPPAANGTPGQAGANPG